MNIKTYEDCVRIEEELQIPPEYIADAFGIPVPKKESSSCTQDDRWKTFRESHDSDVRRTTLESILDNSTDQNEMWEVYGWAPHDSRLSMRALNAIERQCETDLSNSTNQKERWRIFYAAPHPSKIQEAILESILIHSTDKVEVWRVYGSALGKTDVSRAAIRSLCS